MLAYWEFDNDIADAAFNKLAKHQRHLEEEAVMLSIFSDIPIVTNLMIQKMEECLLSMPSSYEFRRKIRLLQRIIKSDSSLTHFIGSDSWW